MLSDSYIIIIIIIIELYSTERRGGTSMRSENTDWWSALKVC